MTGHYTFEWEYKTHHVFHNFNSLAKAKVSRPLVRHFIPFLFYTCLKIQIKNTHILNIWTQ